MCRTQRKRTAAPSTVLVHETCARTPELACNTERIVRFHASCETDTLEKLQQLVRQQELLGLREPPSAQGDPGAADVGESSSSMAGTAASTSVPLRNNSRVAKELRGARAADRILCFYDRVTELEDHLTEMAVNRRNIKNELLTQQHENLARYKELNKEPEEGERAWSSLDISMAPRRALQPPHRDMATQCDRVPLLGDAEWNDGARRSLLSLIQLWNIHTTESNDDDENGPSLRADRNDVNSLVQRIMRRCNARSSLFR